MKKLQLVNKMFKLSQDNHIDAVVFNKQTDKFDPIIGISIRKVYRETYSEYLDKVVKETILANAFNGKLITYDEAGAILCLSNPKWSDENVYEEVCKFRIYNAYCEALYRDMPDFKERYIVKDVIVIETEQSFGNHFE